MTHFCFSCNIKMPEVSAQNSDLQLLCRGPAPEPRRHSPSRSTPANSTSRSFKNGLQPNPDEEHSGGRRPAGCDSLWLSRYDQRSHTAGASSDSPEPRLTRDRFSSTDKLANCCKSVSVSMIQEPITGYMIQKPHPPCVPAVMWVTHLWQRRQRLCLWFWQFKELCLLLPAAFRRQQEFTASISKLTGSKPRSSHSSRFKKRWRSSFLSPAALLLIPFHGVLSQESQKGSNHYTGGPLIHRLPPLHHHLHCLPHLISPHIPDSGRWNLCGKQLRVDLQLHLQPTKN